MPSPSYPQILGSFQNCGLHALTPTIRDLIASDLAVREDKHWRLLKDVFAEFYDLPKEKLTWEAFSNVLQSYSDRDLQLVTGHVLREFMKQLDLSPKLVPLLQ